MGNIIVKNKKELKEKYKSVDMEKIISNILNYYKEIEEPTKNIWSDVIKDFIILEDQDIKYQRDKFTMTTHGQPNLLNPQNKNIALNIARVDEGNYNKILKENNIEIPQEKEKELEKEIDIYFDKTDLARKIIKIQPVYYDENKLWWYWDFQNFKWEITDETKILNFVSFLSRANTVKAKEKGEIIEALRQVSRRSKPKEMEKTWIQFKDMIVDIKTSEEFPASSDYFVTNPIPYGLNKERFIETPVMDKIFEEWVGKDYVKTLYEIIAYSLIPDYPLHRIFCLIGGGMNGKSCFLNLLRKFIGKNNCCSTELDTLLNSRFEITRLHKKLVCLMGETNFNEISKTSILKKLSGGDLIGFEYKNKNPFHESNYAKIIIATNNLPTTSDKTIGFYRRWLIIDFPNQFSEKKDVLSQIPEQEYEILAVKSLMILKDLLDNKEFYNEGDIDKRMKRYEEKSDFFKSFLDEFVNFDSEEFITKRDFYHKFTSWCKERGHRNLGENTVGRKMKEHGVEDSRKKLDFFEGQIRVWEGVKWK